MNEYQHIIFLPGPVFGLVVLTGLVGIIIPSRRSWPAILLWVSAVIIMVLPTAEHEYTYRYVIPAVPLLCMAAALAFRQQDRKAAAGTAPGGALVAGDAPSSAPAASAAPSTATAPAAPTAPAAAPTTPAASTAPAASTSSAVSTSPAASTGAAASTAPADGPAAPVAPAEPAVEAGPADEAGPQNA